MITPHVLLKIRVGQDSEQTGASAAQLFAATPTLLNGWFHRMAKQDEHLAWEIVLIEQSIQFFCYCPERLVEYIKATLIASYPEITITQKDSDPFDTIQLYSEHGYKIETAHIAPENSTLSLKTYRDFSETDPLAAVLSTLSKMAEHENVIIQYSVASLQPWWQHLPIVSYFASSTQNPTHVVTESSAQPEQKQAHRMQVAIKLLVQTGDAKRANNVIESLGAAFQIVNNVGSNTLRLHKTFFFKEDFIEKMKERSLERAPHTLFSIDELATLFHLPNKMLSNIPNIAWGKKLLGEPPENLPIITKDMDAEEKRNINAFATCEYKNQPAIYGIKRADRRRHMYVIGKTGTGKSTLLANMAINDLKNDEGMCVIDPHGDLVDTLLDYIPSRRVNDVIYFDPADPERTVQINLFEGENVVHRELIASGIVSVFQKLYAYSWGPRLEYILRNALLTLLKSPTARLSDIIDLLTDAKFRKKIVENLDDPILKNYWENEFNAMQDKQRQEAIAPILNKVGQFTSSPLIRNVVNAHKSSFSIEEAMDNGKIVLVNLSQGKLGEDNATLLGAMLITKIQLAAMARVHVSEEKRRDFYLYVDEFQNFATDSFVKILSEARKYRLNLTLANQYIDQIPETVQKAIFGNCGSILSFVMGSGDASSFSKEYGGKYSENDLVTLSKHQIINKLAIDNIISLPFPAQTLPLAKNTNGNREKVIRVSRERYAKQR